jgi:GH15 family glucan-1,4-alpha-glucosidase
VILDLVINSWYKVKVQIHKRKNKLKFIKIKKLFFKKDTAKKIKRKTTDWGKYLQKINECT